jgi:glycosyl transferase family 25
MSAPVVIVITQPDSTRQLRVLEHLREMGLEPIVSSAVFLEGDLESCPSYDHRRRISEFGYGLANGEVGCFLAHRMVWEKVVELGVVSLVVEDDARMEPDLPTHLDKLAESIEGTDLIIKLYHNSRNPACIIWRHLTAKISLVRLLRASGAAVAYMLTPEAARNLLDSSARFWLAVDDYMEDEASHGSASLHARPQLIRHEDDGISMIGARRKPARRPLAKVRLECLRLIRVVRQRFHRELTLWRLGIRLRKVTRD